MKNKHSMTLSKQKPVDLLLPRGYLSWSAMLLLETSEEKYIRKYFLDEDVDFSNDFMTFGKRFAEAKEKGDAGGDPMLEFAMNVTPNYGKPEHTFNAVLKTPYGNCTILCKLDDYCEKPPKVVEFKTGKTKWTQAKVQKHGQLHFYSVGVYATVGENPEQELWWIETMNTSAGVRPTGHVEQFVYKCTDAELKEMIRRITNACLRIDKLYRQHLASKK